MEYDIPMMFISGNWDYSMPYTKVQEYAGKIKAPDVRMSIIKDTGCYAMYDSPDEFWSEVAEFVKHIVTCDSGYVFSHSFQDYLLIIKAKRSILL